MSETLKTMTFDAFLEEFEGFEEDDEDGAPVEIDFANHQAIVAAHDARRLWTEFDDGHLENRMGFVNRCRYVMSVKAYIEPMLIIVDAPL